MCIRDRVRENRLVASAVNRMLEAGDPTRHAELEALREGSRQGPLAGAIVYALSLIHICGGG